MKKILSVIAIFLVFCIIPAYSKEPTPENYSFISPFTGTTGIPMDSPAYHTQTAASGWIGDKDKYALREHDKYLAQYNIAAPGTNAETYSDFSMISLGGFGNFRVNSGDTIKMSITVSSPAGLYFVSLANPNIVRPYEVCVFVKHSDDRENKERKFGKFYNSGETIDFIYSGVNPAAGNEIWYDMVLILPGEVPLYNTQNNIKSLADSKNRLFTSKGVYELIPAEDYSSVINIAISLYVNEVLIASDSGSIPLSGHYRKPSAQVAPSANNSAVGLHVLPTSNCANIDINNQQGKYIKIADLNFMSKDTGTLGFNDSKPVQPNVPLPVKGQDEYADWPEYDNVANANKKGYMDSRPAEEDYGAKWFFLGWYTWPNGSHEQEFNADVKKWEKLNNSGKFSSFNSRTQEWNDYQNRLSSWNGNNTNYQNYMDKHSMYIFLSSSDDPFVEGTKFMLIHDEKPLNTPVSERNSIKFNLVMVDKNDPSAVKIFNGTDWYDPNKGTNQLDKFVKSVPSPTFIDSYDKLIQKDFFSSSYNGEIFMVMENKQNLGMIKGRYSEQIYVHVLGPN